MMFADRAEAARRLAEKLLTDPMIWQSPTEALLVLSIPRGGVVAGDIIAQRLGCAHDVVVSKKIGFPRQPEAAIGAVAEDGPAIMDSEMPDWFVQKMDALEHQQAIARDKVNAYVKKFRSGRSLDVRGKTVLLVDDGIATGETMKAAIFWLKAKSEADQPNAVIITAPICSPGAVEELKRLADGMIYLAAPRHFFAVGQFYGDFRQVSDDDVVAMLNQALKEKVA